MYAPLSTTTAIRLGSLFVSTIVKHPACKDRNLYAQLIRGRHTPYAWLKQSDDLQIKEEENNFVYVFEKCVTSAGRRHNGPNVLINTLAL